MFEIDRNETSAMKVSCVLLACWAMKLPFFSLAPVQFLWDVLEIPSIAWYDALRMVLPHQNLGFWHVRSTAHVVPYSPVAVSAQLLIKSESKHFVSFFDLMSRQDWQRIIGSPSMFGIAGCYDALVDRAERGSKIFQQNVTSVIYFTKVILESPAFSNSHVFFERVPRVPVVGSHIYIYTSI